MGLFDDINNFLEERLDEFLRNNPHLELQAIEEQLLEQEQDTRKLISKLQLEEKSLQDRILEIANNIQTWHSRIGKAEAAKRPDLANAASEREAELLRQGNQIWGQMEGVKQRAVKAKELLVQVRQKREEVKAQSAQVHSSQGDSSSTSSSQYSSGTVGWDRGATTASNSRSADPLEAEFQKWEVDEELESIKRNMNK